jgi:hypothetical protein
MKRVSILRGQTVRTYKADHGFGYLPDAVSGFVEQYRFVSYPEVKDILPPDLNTASPPAIFKHGKLAIDQRTVVIDEVQVFQLGLLITAQASTDDTDFIAEDITRWIANRFGLTLESLLPSTHSSSVEVEFERPIVQFFSRLEKVSEAVRDNLDSFWADRLPIFELTALHFGVDPLAVGKVFPHPFRIERRAEMPFAKNLYFSDAPLITSKHIEVLELFERSCLEAL